MARTLVPDNASYDNQCHRRHQHQTVVNVSGVLNSFMNEPTEDVEDTDGDGSGEEDIESEAGEDTGIFTESE